MYIHTLKVYSSYMRTETIKDRNVVCFVVWSYWTWGKAILRGRPAKSN